MQKKEIQERRMKGYFIQAAQEILRGEGLKSLSVRNIADKAGYSYATLYNYFSDVKELIFECVQDFQEECKEFVEKETETIPNGLEKLKTIIKSYMKYFIQYPGIYELFFLEKISDIKSKQPTVELITSFLDRLCEAEWRYCVHNKIFSNNNLIRDEINYLVSGMLLIYLTRRKPNTYKEFLQQADSLLNYIFEKLVTNP